MRYYVTLEGKVKAIVGRSVLFSFINYGEVVERWFWKSVVKNFDNLKVDDTELEVLEIYCVEKDIQP